MSLRAKLYYKIQVLSLSFINNRKPGELMNRVSRDTKQIRIFMEEVFGDMFSTLVTMAVSLVMMLIISWKMTLLSLAFVVAVLVIIRVFWHHIHTIFHKQWLRADDLSSNLQDILSGMRIVKSFGKEERESARFTEKTEAFAAIQKKNETFWAVFFPIMTFLLGVGTYIAIYFGGVQVLEGSMTVGELVQFVTYSGYLFGPLKPDDPSAQGGDADADQLKPYLRCAGRGAHAGGQGGEQGVSHTGRLYLRGCVLWLSDL